MTQLASNHKSTAGWREIGGKIKYFRSLWEANYARYLQFLLERKEIVDWKHEAETFWFPEIKRGVRSYLPDFRVLRADGSIYYSEVKGHMDSKSQTKLNRFKKYYPNHEIYLIDGKWFRANAKKLRLIIPDWEVGESALPKKAIMSQKSKIIYFRMAE